MWENVICLVLKKHVKRSKIQHSTIMDDINGRKEIIFSNDILIFSSLQRCASKWGINYFCKASSSLMINVIVDICILRHCYICMKYHLDIDKSKYELQSNVINLILHDIMTHKGDLRYSAFQHQSAEKKWIIFRARLYFISTFYISQRTRIGHFCWIAV